jgi:hypothetical protein
MRAGRLTRLAVQCGTPGQIRTDTAMFLRHVTPAVGLLGQAGASHGIRTHPVRVLRAPPPTAGLDSRTGGPSG